MKTCIITGATKGIGAAVAKRILADNQFEAVALIGRDTAALDIMKKEYNSEKTILAFSYDLACLDGIPDIVAEIFKSTASIDCLLNIAGYTEPASLLETSIENIKTTYSVNVFAPLLLMRECVKYMKLGNGGKILNVASTAGMSSRPGWVSYASSKAALISAGETLAEELSEYRIKIYTISPGRCATDLRRKLAPNEDQSKIMQPDEVAKIVCNLIRDDENCLDGQNIIIKRTVNK